MNFWIAKRAFILYNDEIVSKRKGAALMEEERRVMEAKNFIDAFILEDIAPGGQFEGTVLM